MNSIFETWLADQGVLARELTASSDIVTIEMIEPQLYLARYVCKGLVKMGGSIREHEIWDIGIHFGDEYLRRFDPAKTVQLISPDNAFMPNCRFPYICPGAMMPGTTLEALVEQCYQIITYQTAKLDDYLNGEAAAWARDHMDRFPIDRRPLRRPLAAPAPTSDFELEFVEEE